MADLKTGAQVHEEAIQREKAVRSIADSMGARRWAVEKTVEIAKTTAQGMSLQEAKALTEYFYEFLTK